MDTPKRPGRMTMTPPKCRLCGKEHWSHEPHVFKEASSRESGKAEKEDGVDKGSRDIHDQRLVDSRPHKNEGFDRKAYQREYMRKWRAKRK